MNAVQIHLALNHLPIALVLIAVPLLAIALAKKSTELKTTALCLIVLAGLTGIPVFLSGESMTESSVEAPRLAQSLVEAHEEAAEESLVFVQMLALVSFAILLFERFKRPVRTYLLAGLLVAGAVDLSLLLRAAHLGGQIGHEEIRTSSTRR